jgi:hypothetical protein
LFWRVRKSLPPAHLRRRRIKQQTPTPKNNEQLLTIVLKDDETRLSLGIMPLS